MIPFGMVIASGVAAVMLSHVIYTAIDPQWPASLSPAIARDLLRQTMGFKGVTITDDLDMGAIQNHFDIETVARQVLDADIDIALICHDRHKMTGAHEALSRTVADSADLRGRAKASVGRLLDLKRAIIWGVPSTSEGGYGVIRLPVIAPPLLQYPAASKIMLVDRSCKAPSPHGGRGSVSLTSIPWGSTDNRKIPYLVLLFS